jgi:predicted FMN-binding regulatory protein PaiB
MLQDLIEFHNKHWDATQAVDYIEVRLAAIVGIEFEIERLEGRIKYNQNKSVDDQKSVINHLDDIDTPDTHEMAAIMRRNFEKS